MLVQRQYTPLEGLTLMVSPASRSYMELDLSGYAMTPDETVARTPAAWLQQLKDLEAKADAELGTEIIDGKQAIGFLIDGSKLGFAPPASEEQSPASLELWVGEESGLPVEMRVSVPMPGADAPITVVLNEFEWDVPIEASLFEPDIPDNYVKLDVKFTQPSEETLLHALNRISELTGGRYTTTLQSVSAIGELPSMLTEAAKVELQDSDEQAMMQTALEIGSGCQYFMQLVRQGREPEYFGGTVTADDADEVLLRWQLEDGQVRVIYGDLRVETLPGD
jgi:hypothetical protein